MVYSLSIRILNNSLLNLMCTSVQTQEPDGEVSRRRMGLLIFKEEEVVRVPRHKRDFKRAVCKYSPHKACM